MITAQPGMLVSIVEAMAKIAERFLGRLTLPQPPTRDQFVYEIRVADGQFGKKFGSIEQEDKQFENAGVAVPQLEERRSRAISANETIQPCHHSVRVRKGYLRSFSFCLEMPATPRCARARAQELGQELKIQLFRPW